MELPENMPEELKKLIRKIEGMGVEHTCQDYSTWVQVGKLTGEEQILKKRSCRRGHEIAVEDRLLFTKHERLLAEVSEIQAVLWQKITKGHSLPPANYHLMDDGRIVMEPGSVERGAQ
jgi:hypothetical protein